MHAAWIRPGGPRIPDGTKPGLCECGCGETTPIAKKTKKDRGQVRGEPLRFINGHNMRLPRSPEHIANAAAARGGKTGLPGALNPAWRGDAAGGDAIHKWLNIRHPKTGVCEECGQRAGGRRGEDGATRHCDKPSAQGSSCAGAIVTPSDLGSVDEELTSAENLDATRSTLAAWVTEYPQLTGLLQTWDVLVERLERAERIELAAQTISRWAKGAREEGVRLAPADVIYELGPALTNRAES